VVPVPAAPDAPWARVARAPAVPAAAVPAVALVAVRTPSAAPRAGPHGVVAVATWKSCSRSR